MHSKNKSNNKIKIQSTSSTKKSEKYKRSFRYWASIFWNSRDFGIILAFCFIFFKVLKNKNSKNFQGQPIIQKNVLPINTPENGPVGFIRH